MLIRRSQRLAGFTEDGKAAIAASPDYFLWWYSVKSILLVGAFGAFMYQLGKNTRRRAFGRPFKRVRR